MLVVDPDAITRRMLRLGLELDGAQVVDATTTDDALLRCKEDGPFAAAAVDAHIPGGTWLDLTDAFDGMPIVVLLSGPDELALPPGVAGVAKGDFAAISRALRLPRMHERQLAVVDLLRREAEEVEADWKELCTWDPMLPPDSQPPVAAAVIDAVTEALGRPQPLGWGADPEVEKVTEVYARAVGAIDVVIGQLICLREVIRRRVASRVPSEEWPETDDRMHMVIDRAIAVAATRTAERLQEQAFLDPLTGLLNRRALERDIRREAGRAARYGRRFGIVMIDLDGLKRVNDVEGHPAGDERLRQLADGVAEVLRLGDAAYRVGGDEFVLMLPDTDDAAIRTVVERVAESGAPAFSWGAAVFPEDGDDIVGLLDAADARLLLSRRSRRDRQEERRPA